MANPAFFQPVFDRLATNGCIGNPSGKPAFAYLRVSDSDQAEDGRSGLPRQILHIHEAAQRHGYRVPWEFVFADDHTGFEFERRPQLSRLRNELRSPRRRADAVIIEHLDRLSRNADWHQGFLLEEMKTRQVTVIFWHSFGSLIERSVLGAVAQQGMEQQKRRMMEGKLHKARSGRVTASVPAYGYVLVDSNGNEGLTARRDTHYAYQDTEFPVVRLMYERVICGDTLRGIAHDLEEAGIPPPKKYRHWEPTQVRLIIRNEVYKGDFYAHRWEHKKEERLSADGVTMRTVSHKVERPKEEWIHVPVPPIVTAEEWEAANRMLDQNRRMSRRNAIEPYLLTGLIRCTACGYRYSGTTSHRSHLKPRNRPSRAYRCTNAAARPRHVIEEVGCDNGQILCEIIDNAIWQILCDVLLQPAVLIDTIEAEASDERNTRLQEQIAYLEKAIADKADDEEKLYRAYMAEAFDEQEYAARRKLVKSEEATMREELERLRAQVLTPEQVEARKLELLTFAEQVKAEGIPLDPPFALKQRIIKMLVNEIVLNVRDGWFTLEGALSGAYPIVSNPGPEDSPNGSPIESNRTGRDSSRLKG